MAVRKGNEWSWAVCTLSESGEIIEVKIIYNMSSGISINHDL